MNACIAGITDFIFVEDQPADADAVFVVGGSYPEAAELAADLWKKGFAPHILVGGGVSVKTGVFPGARSKAEFYPGPYATECAFYTDALLKCGVPRTAILGEERSGFTRQNAQYARVLADTNNLEIKRGLLVCKAFHARRCLLFYQAAFPKCEFRVIPFAGFDVTKENWYLSHYGIQRVLGELKRCGDQISKEDVEKYRCL